MSKETSVVRCPQCGAKNRVPKDRWREQAVCGRCKAKLNLSLLYPDSPVDVDDATFEEEVVRFPGPVLIDFTAPW